jgi:transposase
MRPVFKDYSQGQITLFPASLNDRIPQDSPVRLVNEIVDKLDISNIIKTYKGGGASSYSPCLRDENSLGNE